MPEVDIGRILEEKVLRDFRRLFYEITGMITSFWLPGWEKGLLDLVPSDAQLPFCKIVKSCPEGLACCLRSDEATADRVIRARRPVVTSCYAGLTGVGLPVFFKDKLLGAMLSGNCLSRNPSPAGFLRVKKRLKGLDLDFAELEKAYYQIPVVNQHKIRIAQEMLSLIVNYIIDREQMLELQETIYQRQGDLAREVAARASLERHLEEGMEEVRMLRRHFLAGASADSVQLGDSTTRRKRLLYEVMEFIDSFYSGDISLQDAADHVDLSASYLSSIFREEYGYSFMDYLIWKRISRACELLRDTRMNVTEVALSVGYTNISYFNQVFKRLTGMPPGKYRNSVYASDKLNSPVSSATTPL